MWALELALRSGVKTIALRSGGASEGALIEAGAAYVFASVKDLFETSAVHPQAPDMEQLLSIPMGIAMEL